jgi:hypothetical protein
MASGAPAVGSTCRDSELSLPALAPTGPAAWCLRLDCKSHCLQLVGCGRASYVRSPSICYARERVFRHYLLPSLGRCCLCVVQSPAAPVARGAWRERQRCWCLVSITACVRAAALCSILLATLHRSRVASALSAAGRGPSAWGVTEVTIVGVIDRGRLDWNVSSVPGDTRAFHNRRASSGRGAEDGRHALEVFEREAQRAVAGLP